MLLSVIIVSYNTSNLLYKCIESIFESSLNCFELEVIVVDNNSIDDSQNLIKLNFPQVNWIQLSYNSGFSRANNSGISVAKGKYLLFLNSDIILNSNTILECIEYIKAKPKVGVLSCRLLNEDGSIQKFETTIASFRKIIDNNLIINYFFPIKEMKKEAVMGSFMLIPKEVIQKSGCFDPDFFFFSEEIELCNRIRNLKYNIDILENVFAYHKGSGSNTDRTWANRQAYLSVSLLFLKVRSYAGFYFYQFILFFNFATNFFAMWFIDKNYRKGYFVDLKNYLKVFLKMMSIPFLFSNGFGKNKRLLKY